ncbi:hypothetical protein SAMN05444000_115112 [Shimia gijangensis]|uniref:Winged helix-turn-helix domain-containing protein n=1 Tax=Shimia gijangensis TaxID=1470563 RepID=A0A1M6NBU9_9RHOB|nr:crosslink repair DNA glycosylase YcaQ family protein [Shimia gijangensis]SHJ93152.1 hypothetical protein SAMN05444000_115112 [Shimia gijangensis]
MADGSALRISNRQARALWLAAQGLSGPPTGHLDLQSIISRLGFVQLDTIQVVSRAHHHILWSRNQHYREPMLDELLRRRDVFEHFTHDASVLPMEFLPMWQRQFDRKARQMGDASWFKGLPDEAGRAEIRARIAKEGALSTHAFDTKIEGQRKMWARPPHKVGLDYMWYAGELATCHRENFTKFYDLAERVFPDHLRNQDMADADQVDWLNRGALDRMGFGTIGDIKRFWDAVATHEVRDWVDTTTDLVAVEIQGSDGALKAAMALPDIEQRLASLATPTSRLRILNPFDPVIRDRARLEFLFGFEYRIEMFVPAAKRKWGYYIYPILEGDRLVGRCEIKAERAKGRLVVKKLWPESHVKWPPARQAKFEAEVDRMARFVGVANIVREDG